jgi:hypothetical protein
MNLDENDDSIAHRQWIEDDPDRRAVLLHFFETRWSGVEVAARETGNERAKVSAILDDMLKLGIVAPTKLDG